MIMEVQTARVESDRLNKEVVLRDFARFSWRVARGLDEVNEAEAGTLVRRLGEVGRITSDQGIRLLTGLQFRIQSSRQRFTRRIATSVQTAIIQIQAATQREVARLHGRLFELDKRLERLSKKV